MKVIFCSGAVPSAEPRTTADIANHRDVCASPPYRAFVDGAVQASKEIPEEQIPMSQEVTA